MKASSAKSSASPRRHAWLERILPFESALARYAIVGWIALGMLAASWTHAYRVPQADQVLAIFGDLFDLENQVRNSDSAFVEEELALLRNERQTAAASLYASQDAIESRIAHLVEDLRTDGWRANIAPERSEPQRRNYIETRRYSLELIRPRPTAATPGRAEAAPDTATAAIARAIGSIAEPHRGRLEIDRFSLASEPDGRLKVQLELTAYLAKER